MFNQSNVIYLAIWALAIGLAAAFVYTNLQRTALSKFINSLVLKGCFDKQSSLNLKQLGLTKYQRKIIRRACFKHYGLKRIITMTEQTSENHNDELSAILGKKKSYRYSLKTSDTQDIIKKYSFKSMPLYQIILFCAALLLTAFLITKAYDLFYNYVYVPKINEQVQSQEKDDVIDKNDVTDKNVEEEHGNKNTSEKDNNIVDNSDAPSLPTIPTLPVLPD